MRQESLLEGLARELRDLPNEMSASPASYLRAAFLPDSINSWLPLSLANHFAGEVAYFFRHPIQFIKGLLSPDAISLGYIYQPAYTAAIGFTSYVFSAEKRHIKRSPLLISLLSVSAVFHAVFITYLLYIAIIAPYANVRVVNKPYREYEDKLVAVSPVQLQRLGGSGDHSVISLEEIQEKARKRKEEEERRKRLEEARKRREEERQKTDEEKTAAQAKADQEAKDKAAAEQAKAAEQKTNEPAKFGEINEAPIKAILGKVYAMYSVGFAKVDVTNLTMTASFKIEKDGSITNINVYKSSGDRFIDTQAKAVLHNLGESHALTPLAILTSNTIQLELTEKTSRLSIVGFAPTPKDAENLAKLLNLLFLGMRLKGGSSPDVAELMKHMKVTYSGNRVEANLIISRERAAEMMKTKFGNNGAQ